MRLPAGAPSSGLLRLQQKFPNLVGRLKFKRPPNGTLAVWGFLGLTGTAGFFMFVMPHIYRDFYRQSQSEKRAHIHADRVELAGGLRPWSDPFDREKKISAMADSKPQAPEPPTPSDEPQEDEREHNRFDLSTFPADEAELDLTHTVANEIPDVSRFFQSLTMRNNLLKEINTRLNVETLTELDLYENQIAKIENLEKLVNLEHLDLSFNRLTKIEGLATLTKLRNLYFVHNKLTKIEGLETLVNLEYLELGDNRIKKIENLDKNTRIQRLFLGANRIQKIENLGHLQELVVLSLGRQLHHHDREPRRADRPPRVVPLAERNRADRRPRKRNTELEILDLNNNQLKRIENVAHLKKLTDFWGSQNKFENFADLKELSELPELTGVYFDMNPWSQQTHYRSVITHTLLHLTSLDGWPCKPLGSGGADGEKAEADGLTCGHFQSSLQQTNPNEMAEAQQRVEELEVAEDGHGFFAVTPLDTCPHLTAIKPNPPEIDVQTPCKKCGVEGENWICLVCYEVHCGRYVGGHAVEHAKDEGHPMALSFADFSSWCYECNAYVHNEALTAAKDAAYKNKFGEEN
ncbi:Histone deacetylase 6 [Aphelenchoides fujianensis]|nr:Histone deacetylase 6 [Aphelenchoides fujianensis]